MDQQDLLKASQFQEQIYSLVEYLDYIPYQKIQIQHLLITVVVISISIISFRLGKKKESNNFLSDRFRRKLEEFEQDAQIVNKRIEKNEDFIKKIYNLQILCFVVTTCYLIYIGFIEYQEDNNNKLIITSIAIIVIEACFQMYKNHLNTQIKQLNFKIQEDKNQQNVIMMQLISEMSEKMKNILSDILAKKIVNQCESEKEGIKKLYDQKIKTLQAESESERDSLKKKYETRISGLTQQQSSDRILCKSNICKKKRKLLKEKLKRSDWFIRNLSEFAWCSICASNMYEDPTQSFIENNISDQSINLEDSIMLNNTLTEDQSNDDDGKQGVFNKLNGSKGEVIKKECENNCLSKYFFLCKKIGEKYNNWTDIIDKFESKYKAEKLKLKQLNAAQ
ncbi:transmembrane protein, putative (macronuclear) [Tetrahymena thermophila SB210]|uniref:Transmembrane protein, putative n=1 Tax=Tetrahymena thermophila (strain SB210) TaxID=312017 RepID=Q245E5_TETTS|nr:transmembrane protein, putative [Tetrahymena thermophila SB210]EAS03419.2 transmembrane protein, putative [Tetrahymena thermophila SB210]|eukprot:XP_001023664.2 transmembrane protein, putative [Tetrahymena thermophila SB210]